MNVIDISWPISSATTAYKDKQTIKLEPSKIFEKDNARETIITLSSHTGTHVDAPAHFLQDGKTIDQMVPSRFVGPCTILDMTGISEQITRDDLITQTINMGDIILIKTANSALSSTDKFMPNFVYLETSGARYLAEKKIKAVGIDYLSIERNQPDHATHTTCMHADIAIIEGLRLQHVQPGNYLFVCLPLPLVGLDGAPARAVLIT